MSVTFNQGPQVQRSLTQEFQQEATDLISGFSRDASLFYTQLTTCERIPSFHNLLGTLQMANDQVYDFTTHDDSPAFKKGMEAITTEEMTPNILVSAISAGATSLLPLHARQRAYSDISLYNKKRALSFISQHVAENPGQADPRVLIKLAPCFFKKEDNPYYKEAIEFLRTNPGCILPPTELSPIIKAHIDQLGKIQEIAQLELELHSLKLQMRTAYSEDTLYKWSEVKQSLRKLSEQITYSLFQEERLKQPLLGPEGLISQAALNACLEYMRTNPLGCEESVPDNMDKILEAAYLLSAIDSTNKIIKKSQLIINAANIQKIIGNTINIMQSTGHPLDQTSKDSLLRIVSYTIDDIQKTSEALKFAKETDGEAELNAEAAEANQIINDQINAIIHGFRQEDGHVVIPGLDQFIAMAKPEATIDQKILGLLGDNLLGIVEGLRNENGQFETEDDRKLFETAYAIGNSLMHLEPSLLYEQLLPYLAEARHVLNSVLLPVGPQAAAANSSDPLENGLLDMMNKLSTSIQDS